MTSTFTALGYLSVFFVLALLYLWSAYNSFVTKRNQVKTDYSDIDIQLKRRASLIENLVTLVKEYAKHEKDTFENVTKARSALDADHHWVICRLRTSLERWHCRMSIRLC